MINWLEKFLLRRIIGRSCPDRIPRSGEKGKRVKCYVIYLKRDAEYLLCVDKISSKGFSGTLLNDQEDKRYPASVPFNLMSNVSIEIQRYLGVWDFSYPGVFQCILDDWTYRNRLPIIIDTINQFFYNQKTLALKERTDILRILVERYIKEPDDAFGEFKLVEIIHGQRWINHQDSAKQLAHARIILESLCESGELRFVRDNNSQFSTNLYKLTGKALATLETYERDEKRHNQIRNLTCALVIVGIIQTIAGLVQAYVAYSTVKP